MKGENPAKEHYRRLRELSCAELWENEVAAFDALDERGRMEHVAVVRAVGVAFSESGTPEQKERARQWLRGLLRDPLEKVRRYAMNALPKFGADTEDEADLLELLAKGGSDRERKAVGQVLEKIGGVRTMESAERLGAPSRTLQKVRGNVARSHAGGRVRLDGRLEGEGCRIHLRCRSGLEEILREEVSARGAGFSVIRCAPGLVAVESPESFLLSSVFELRCFSTAGFALGTADDSEGLARRIASSQTRQVLEAFTAGPIRYRLNFCGRGHLRGMVRAVTDRVFELTPELINDSREAPWQIDVHRAAGRMSVELVPRLRPDPRFAYRRQDVPAASHPPLAACMARLAGDMRDEVVWDPFCGSGLELVESALRGNVRRVVGTDRSADAVEIARANLASALGDAVESVFACGDFRDHARIANLQAGSASLVISNPPMGRRVPIPNLRGLIADLFSVAGQVLRPGGRLVFANPVPVKPDGGRFILEHRSRVDLGGFDVHVERWLRR